MIIIPLLAKVQTTAKFKFSDLNKGTPVFIVSFSGIANPICRGRGQCKRPLPFLPDFSSFSWFFPSFSRFSPSFPQFFPIFGKFFPVGGDTRPPWTPLVSLPYLDSPLSFQTSLGPIQVSLEIFNGSMFISLVSSAENGPKLPNLIQKS